MKSLLGRWVQYVCSTEEAQFNKICDDVSLMMEAFIVERLPRLI